MDHGIRSRKKGVGVEKGTLYGGSAHPRPTPLPTHGLTVYVNVKVNRCNSLELNATQTQQVRP